MPRGRPKRQPDALIVSNATTEEEFNQQKPPIENAPPPKQRWEYKDVLYNQEYILNVYALDGYRLVTIYVIGGGTFEQQRRAVFEREVSDG